jgi:hypothetical protein
MKGFEVFRSLPQAKRLGDSVERVHRGRREHISLNVAVI